MTPRESVKSLRAAGYKPIAKQPGEVARFDTGNGGIAVVFRGYTFLGTRAQLAQVRAAANVKNGGKR